MSYIVSSRHQKCGHAQSGVPPASIPGPSSGTLMTLPTALLAHGALRVPPGVIALLYHLFLAHFNRFSFFLKSLGPTPILFCFQKSHFFCTGSCTLSLPLDNIDLFMQSNTYLCLLRNSCWYNDNTRKNSSRSVFLSECR